LTRHISPCWQGPFKANLLNAVPANSTDFVKSSDFWFITNGNNIQMLLKSNSKMALHLQLRELLLSNYNPKLNLNNNDNENVSFENQAVKHGGSFAMPFKFEYTDSLGTQHVLWQGLAHLGTYVLGYGTDGTIVGGGDYGTNERQYAWLSQPFADSGKDIDLDITEGKHWAYIFTLAPVYESGFANPLRDTVGANAAFLPYATQNLCAYVDSSDIVLVPETNKPTYGSSFITRYHSNQETTTWSTTDLKDQSRYANWGIGNSPWNYSVKNVEMICDFVKPSSEVFLQFQQSFQAPAGIPYAYKRILYHTRVLNPSDGLQQISLPISVRSLRGIVCVLSDKVAWSPSSDGTSKSFNGLSSFMKRGLIRAQLVIGGQNYPSYDLNLTENGFEQIPELECLFNVAGLGSFNPAFHQKELQSTRNYVIGLGKSDTGVNAFDGQWTNVTSHAYPSSNQGFQEFHDTSKFVLGLSTMKKDGDFVTGVDTSQAGSVSLNLFFKRSPDVANMFPGDSGSNRDIFVQVFCLADAVFTLQNDANLVRY
jgi:hypothetical protein